ncbi:MAG: ABC transporter substrate-binding protein [Pseudomonadota bacterium]|nr:ABC transporter substrate-binding protein [Pseudomonadota bacterium]
MRIPIAVALACIALHLSAATGAGPSARSVVETLQSGLLESMKQGIEADFPARYALLAPVVTETHDFDTVGRLVIGRKYWGALQAEQQRSFLDTFRELSIATYTDNFSAWSGERFEVLSEEKTPRGNQLVRTGLTKADGEQVLLDYVLKTRDGDWLIINVIADGVSDLALKRSEYTQVLDDRGYDALIEMLRGKIAQAAK